MVICLHMAQLMPLLLTVSCFNKIQIGFTFLVPAHPGIPGKRAVKRVCVCLGGLNVRHKPTARLLSGLYPALTHLGRVQPSYIGYCASCLTLLPRLDFRVYFASLNSLRFTVVTRSQPANTPKSTSGGIFCSDLATVLERIAASKVPETPGCKRRNGTISRSKSQIQSDFSVRHYFDL